MILSDSPTISAAAVALTAIIAGAIIWNLKPTPEPPKVTRFYYELPEDQQFYGSGEAVLAVSPDGKQFVYSTNEELYLRSIGELDAKLIAGTNKENIGNPFFSPDGK